MRDMDDPHIWELIQGGILHECPSSSWISAATVGIPSAMPSANRYEYPRVEDICIRLRAYSALMDSEKRIHLVMSRKNNECEARNMQSSNPVNSRDKKTISRQLTKRAVYVIIMNIMNPTKFLYDLTCMAQWLILTLAVIFP